MSNMYCNQVIAICELAGHVVWVVVVLCGMVSPKTKMVLRQAVVHNIHCHPLLYIGFPKSDPFGETEMGM